MKKEFLAAGFVLFSFMLSPKAMASTFSKFYVFGDSLSETGNILNATGGFIPSSPTYARGRFSNGDIWVDFVGDEIGLNPTLFTNNPNPTESINFASGGSFSGSRSENLFPPASNLNLPGVLGQVNLFTQSLQANNQQADPNALYTVWGGANDYLFGGVTDPTETVTNLSNAIGNLAQAGAKNIAVFNLPDLGKIPFAIANGVEVSTGLTQLTLGHNAALEQALDGFSVNSDVNIIRVDINSLFNRVVANPGEFGFTQNPAIPCVIGDTLNNSIASLCDNPNEFVFFDGVHPSSKAHRLIADATLSAIQHQPIPEPPTLLSTLAVGAIGTVGILKSKRKKLLR